MQVEMTALDNILNFLPTNDLNLYLELGNDAMKEGKAEESFDWYMKGLRRARELQNPAKISEFSGLIITLL